MAPDDVEGDGKTDVVGDVALSHPDDDMAGFGHREDLGPHLERG